MLLPVSTELLQSEILSARDILDRQLAKLEAGVPGQDIPATRPEALLEFVDQLCGELLVAAGKLETVVSVVGNTTRRDE
jgi:hypothetical protein